jgi:hypothetical protein
MRESNANGLRVRFALASILASLLALSFACGGAPSSQGDAGSSSEDVPELTDDMIRERLNFAYVRTIPREDGQGEPMNWRFIPNEPKEITIVDKKIEGDHATIVLDIKTSSGPRASGPRSLSGQIRTEWQLKTGWVLRQWEIVETENISMKYKNLPKPSPDNSNQ